MHQNQRVSGLESNQPFKRLRNRLCRLSEPSLNRLNYTFVED